MRGDKEVNGVSDTQLPPQRNNGHSVWSKPTHPLISREYRQVTASRSDEFTVMLCVLLR